MSYLEPLRELALAAPERPDWDSYAEMMTRVLGSADRFHNVDALGSFLAEVDPKVIVALVDVAVAAKRLSHWSGIADLDPNGHYRTGEFYEALNELELAAS